VNSPDRLWKSEGRDHTGFKGAKQVVLVNFCRIIQARAKKYCLNEHDKV